MPTYERFEQTTPPRLIAPPNRFGTDVPIPSKVVGPPSISFLDFPLGVSQTPELDRSIQHIQSQVDYIVESNAAMMKLATAMTNIAAAMMATKADANDGPDNHDMTVEQVRDLIRAKYEPGKSVYPSDIANEHNLDYDTVVEAIDLLWKEHRAKDGGT